VLADARDPESPLHDCFEWDDAKAAAAYRIDQARVLIRSIEIVVTTDTTIVRAPCYVRDPEMAGDEQGYIATKVLRNEKDLAREALVLEFARVAHLLRRARNLAKALAVEGDVERLLVGVLDLKSIVEATRPASPS
jgi:hypothetical protein